QEFIGFRNVLPICFGEFDVATLRDVVVYADDVKRGGVRRRVCIGVGLEPVHKTSALRNFMGNLSIFTLERGDEFERGFAGSEIAFAVQREIAPQRVAPEKPCKARTVTFAGGAIAGNKPVAHGGIGNESLDQAYA